MNGIGWKCLCKDQSGESAEEDPSTYVACQVLYVGICPSQAGVATSSTSCILAEVGSFCNLSLPSVA